MFIISSEPNKHMQALLLLPQRIRGVRTKLGHIPPHWELFASVNPIRFKMFLNEINYLNAHQNIEKDFFTFLRYAISHRQRF